MTVEKKTGAVLVVGGGLAGIQAALDLADGGFYVYLLEQSSAIGSSMARLDRTFPTNDCSMCIMAPQLVACGRHANITIICQTEVEEILGAAGNFTVTVYEKPRYVDPNHCIACGLCAEKCPVEVKDPVHADVSLRRAIHISYPQAVPSCYTIDASSCLHLNGKAKCTLCMSACERDAINFNDQPRTYTLQVGAIILAPGGEIYNPSQVPLWGYGKFGNVITALQFEQYLSPTGPTGGKMLRPSDQQPLRKIAFLQCIGSRDEKIPGNSHCSAVCCMSAIKEAMLARELAPDLSVTIFFSDMRTHGKDFDRYLQQARDEANIRFVRSRIFGVEQDAATKGNLRLRYANEEGRQVEDSYEMVILSTGLQTSLAMREKATAMGITLTANYFAATSDFFPVRTSREGIFVCGVFCGPKDIAQSVIEGSASAAAAAELLASARNQVAIPEQIEVAEEMAIDAVEPRIGVFICHCGSNIAGVINIGEITEFCKTLPKVCHVEHNLFSCAHDTQEQIVNMIKKHQLNRIVIGACSPKTHEHVFAETLKKAGHNPHMVEIANIRNHCSWVHRDNPAQATAKACVLLRMAAAKSALAMPYSSISVPIVTKGLVIGGGVAGMNAALNLAGQGFEVHLIERTNRFGGNAVYLKESWSGEHIPSYLKKLINQVMWNEKIILHTEAEIIETAGHVGHYTTTIREKNNRLTTIEHGVVIIATGASIFSPQEYRYPELKRVITAIEFDKLRELKEKHIRSAKTIVFIQCVGSREDQAQYCSKVCCTHSVKAAIEVKREDPGRNIFILYREMRTYGQRENLFRQAVKMGIIFLKYTLDNKPEVTGDNEKVRIIVDDHILHRPLQIDADLVVLATAIRPRPDGRELANRYRLPVDEDGFFSEAHAKLKPVDLPVDGIFVAGLAQYPKPIEESIAQSLAAAGRASSFLARPVIPLDVPTAVVNKYVCDGCALCIDVCPYQAITLVTENQSGEDHKTVIINTANCKGCGLCQGTCPKHCIYVCGFSPRQISSQIEAALAE